VAVIINWQAIGIGPSVGRGIPDSAGVRLPPEMILPRPDPTPLLGAVGAFVGLWFVHARQAIALLTPTEMDGIRKLPAWAARPPHSRYP
jgi:hypothetical protein